jgi:hypothetical protein
VLSDLDEELGFYYIDQHMIHAYHSRFIPVGVAEISQTFLQDTKFYQNDSATRNTADVKGGKPIAI